jgi:hypothetical protein
MEKLKLIIDTYPRWQPYQVYVDRINGFQKDDFSVCIENAKALLEGVSRNICDLNGVLYSKDDSVTKLLKTAFESLGYSKDDPLKQIGGSISNIGAKINDLRNEKGATSHGKTAEELQRRNENFNDLTAQFLILSTELVCSFLIQLFETENIKIDSEESEIIYEENESFNEFWDEIYGEFEMGDYSFPASQVLYSVDRLAYETEINAYNLLEDEVEE